MSVKPIKIYTVEIKETYKYHLEIEAISQKEAIQLAKKEFENPEEGYYLTSSSADDCNVKYKIKKDDA